MVPLFTVLTFLGSLVGGVVFVAGWASANGAPQEAAAAAGGVALAVIPYVLLRCAQIEAQRAHEKRMLEAMERLAEWTKE